MRILLINCPNRLSRHPEFFPYGIGLLASIGKMAGHEVSVYDCNLNRNIETLTQYLEEIGPWDIIGLSGLVTTYDYQNTLSFLIRKIIPSAIILSGGGLASSVPELLLAKSEIDVACVGEGERIFQELLNALNEGWNLSEVRGIVWKTLDGNIITNLPAVIIDDLDELPFPDWDTSGLNKYFSLSGFSHKGENASLLKRRADLTTTRGCPYRCSFCSNVFSRNKIRARSISNVIEEISVLVDKFNVQTIDFLDENFCYSKRRVTEFCEKLLDLGIRISWGTAARVDNVDRELLKLMKEAGCVFILYGIESGSQEILELMQKKTTVDQAWEAFVETENAGIHAHGNLIIGHPGESLFTLRDSLKFQKRRFEYYKNKYAERINDPVFKEHLWRYFGTVSFCTPYPGSSVYDEHKKKIDSLDAFMSVLTFRDAKEFTVNLTELSVMELIGAQHILSSPELWDFPNLI